MDKRPSWPRIALAAVLGGALFALISAFEVSTGSSTKAVQNGVGGIFSIFVWIAIGLYLRAGPLAAAGIGAWTGLVAIAISFGVVQQEHIAPLQIDGSRVPLVTAQSFVIWPVLGALVCFSSDLTHRLGAGAGCLAIGGIALAAAVAAFFAALGLH